METIKYNKMMQEAYRRYRMSDAYTLWDVYGSFSRAKENAFKYCEKLCAEHGGDLLKVLGAGSSLFSCGFTYTNKDDGKKYFVYITKDHDRQCVIED